ncbi:rubrerythrin-like domain-containing protein [Natronomonas sp. EA1]
MHPNPEVPNAPLYECEDCGARVTEERHTRVCPECDGFLRNIAIPRGE